jgi:hypothetical protein
MGLVMAWIVIFIIMGAGGLFSWYLYIETDDTYKVKTVVATMGICIAISCVIIWFLYFTEGGKRTQKTYRSEVSGGLYRTVKVYDMEGELIEQYEGKFDVDESATSGITKIKFDMDGKRHIIYCTTGTVVIDEIEPKEGE